MYICGVCKKSFDATVNRPIYNYSGSRTCRSCAEVQENFLIDRIEITEKGVELVSPYANMDEDLQRDKLIEFLYLLFDREVNPRTYKLINDYVGKGMSYLDIARAMEYFVIIKKNSIAKAKNSIGIVPYVVEDAKKYYNIQADKALTKAKQWYKESQAEIEVKTFVTSTKEEKVNTIDMNDLL